MTIFFSIAKKQGKCGSCYLSCLECIGCFLPRLGKPTWGGKEGSFVGKKRRTVWNAGPLCLFWSVWKTRNKIAFEGSVLSIQKLKAFFVYLLWSESKLFIKDGPLTLIDFIDWVSSR